MGVYIVQPKGSAAYRAVPEEGGLSFAAVAHALECCRISSVAGRESIQTSRFLHFKQCLLVARSHRD
jgi:hypothetical protein